jgi:hypothetical protein
LPASRNSAFFQRRNIFLWALFVRWILSDVLTTWKALGMKTAVITMSSPELVVISNNGWAKDRSRKEVL